MSRKKIVVAFGTRPEAIKLIPILYHLKESTYFETCVCVTGQHREMILPILERFGIEVHHNLEVMEKSQTLASLTSRILTRFTEVLVKEEPDAIIVHGDTTTTFACGLAATYAQIPVFHVEAGLRTHTMYSPFPEELNRTLVGHMTSLHFAPTLQNKNNLLTEGILEKDIHVVGNTAVDMVNITKTLKSNRAIQTSKRIVLLTAHRRENLNGLSDMFKGIRKGISTFDDVLLVYPVHMNPKIRELVSTIFTDEDAVEIIEPLDVVEFHDLMRKSSLIITDSGGIQEEASFMGKRTLIMRETTERQEAVNSGNLVLVGTDSEVIANAIEQELKHPVTTYSETIFGEGNTSEKILYQMQRYFEEE